MRAVERGKAAVRRAVEAATTSAEPGGPSPRRLLAATILPLLVVFVIETFFWRATGRWSLLYPAVLVCAWLGGFESGIAATLLSAGLVWWFFVPPEHTVVKPSASPYGMAVFFVLMGILLSGLVRRLQRSGAELARHQRFLQGILDHSPDAIVIKDLESRYILVNRAFEDLTGVRAAAALEHTDLDLFPRALAEAFRAKDKMVRDSRTPLHFEEQLGTGNGHVLLVSEFPLLGERRGVFAIGAIATDISQRKHDEEALRESLEDLRAAQHVAHVGSWRWDFRTNRATWSDELYQIFGIDAARSATPIINPGLKLLSGESLAKLLAAMEKLRADGQPYELDLEFSRPDGARRWCAARGEPLRDAAGEIIGIAGTVADITHIKDLERLRDEWTSIVAHDLRQPIGVISMASEFLPELHRDPSSEERAMVQHIQSAAHALKRMVDDLLDMSLLEAHRLKLERTWVDPHVVLRETVEKLSRLGGARVEFHVSGGPISAFVDRVRLEQVFGNLISNAIKYGEKNAGIEVRLDAMDGEVKIAVTNRGAGIDPDDVPSLFDRFTRSKKTRDSRVKGLGLGLYIAKGIIEAHGGRIWAESTPGRSTTFYVSLPAAARTKAA